MKPVKKAVIPAAGFGTRFLPFAKAVPKEMLPIVDTPVIEFVVEEAVRSGLTDILIIVSRSKRAIEEHFHSNPELEADLLRKSKGEALATVTKWNHAARLHFVWQQEMKGLGDAVSHAANHVGDEPFALLLGDTMVSSSDPQRPVTRQLMEVHQKTGGSVIALEEVPLEKVSRYGIVGGNEDANGVVSVDTLVEKPSPENAPSRLAISSRYLLTPGIFQALVETPPGKGGEIQLTDALVALMKTEPLHGLRFAGRRYDLGNKLEFLKTNVLHGLHHPETAVAFRQFIRDLAASPAMEET